MVYQKSMIQCHHNHVTTLRFDIFEYCSFWLKLFATHDLFKSLTRIKCLGVNKPQKQGVPHSSSAEELACQEDVASQKKEENAFKYILSSSLVQLVMLLA